MTYKSSIEVVDATPTTAKVSVGRGDAQVIIDFYFNRKGKLRSKSSTTMRREVSTYIPKPLFKEVCGKAVQRMLQAKREQKDFVRIGQQLGTR